MKRETWLTVVTCLAVVGVLLLWSESSFAQATLDSGDGVVNEIGRRIMAAMGGWRAVIQIQAERLFWILVSINLVWVGTQLVLRKGDISDVIGEITRFMLFIGFFWWLLQNGIEMGMSLINGMQELGKQASGMDGTDVAQIVDKGFIILQRAFAQFQAASGFDANIKAIFLAVASIFVLILLALVALNFILVKFGAYITVYAGLILLGLGGSRFTSDIAVNYFKGLLAQGLKLLTLACILAVGNNLLTTYYELLGEGAIALEAIAAFLCFCVILLVISNKVPDMVAGMASGHLHTGGVGSVGALTVAATAAAAAGAVAAAGVSVAKGAAGAAMAIKEARQGDGDNRGVAETSGKGGQGGAGGGSGAGISKAGAAAAMGGGTGAAMAAESAGNASGELGGASSPSAGASGAGIRTGAADTPRAGSPGGSGNAGSGGGSTPAAAAGGGSGGGAASAAAGDEPTGSIGASGSGGRASLREMGGALSDAAIQLARTNIETTTRGGRIAAQIRSTREGNRRLAVNDRKAPAGQESNPQEEINAFVRGN